MAIAINLDPDRTDTEDLAAAKQAAVRGMVYCRICLDGCNHSGDQLHHDDGGEPGSCEHRGCWGPDSTNDCAGIEFAKAVYEL